MLFGWEDGMSLAPYDGLSAYIRSPSLDQEVSD